MTIKRYLSYLSYVLRHKWYVMLECFKRGLYWHGLVHDISKFLPSEFIPYARYFYDKEGKRLRGKRDKTGYYKPTDTGDPAFDFAWMLHQKRNRHHWQWWVLPEDEGGMKVLEMPLADRLEMLCDWHGASRAQKTTGTVVNWWRKNSHKMTLHPDTKKWIEWELIWRHGPLGK